MVERAFRRWFGLDELRLLAGRNNPYWGGEVFALTQAAAAGLTGVGWLVVFVRRGLA